MIEPKRCPVCGKPREVAVGEASNALLASLRAEVIKEQRTRYLAVEIALRRVVRGAEIDRDGLPWPDAVEALRSALADLDR